MGNYSMQCYELEEAIRNTKEKDLHKWRGWIDKETVIRIRKGGSL